MNKIQIFYKNKIRGLAIIIVLIGIFICIATTCWLYKNSYSNLQHHADLRAKAMTESIALAVRHYESLYTLLPYQYSDYDMVFDEHHHDEYDFLVNLLIDRNCMDDFGGTPLKDPFGNRYIIIMDTNYDGEIIINGVRINLSTIVYSMGLNMQCDKGGNDDICSWK